MPEDWAMPPPSAATVPPETFVEEVRAVLDHLYDYAFLHNHPLTWRLCADGGADGVTRAQRMRTLLLDAIEHLRPAQRLNSDEMRAYAILTLSLHRRHGDGRDRRQAGAEPAPGLP